MRSIVVCITAACLALVSLRSVARDLIKTQDLAAIGTIHRLLTESGIDLPRRFEDLTDHEVATLRLHYSQQQRGLLANTCYDAWVKQEIRRGGLPELPACPCAVPFDGPAPEGFDLPLPADQCFHPGSTHCIRETNIGIGAGQQCCYDAAGTLITNGLAAGTSDRVGPSSNILSGLTHFYEDVLPYWYCPCSTYLLYRPIDNSNQCPSNEVNPCQQ